MTAETLTPAVDRVRRAAQASREWHTEYLASLVAAHAGGATYAELARAAGVTRQAVRELVTREVARP